jgi:hypothetical protein
MLRGVRSAALMTDASFAEIGNARPMPQEERHWSSNDSSSNSSSKAT